ncbi:S66 peptidase family protein [Chryseolinea soli]|uniref:LD-carboxypeptidase n=1 Tax=Chryseolinea soli TaxID=2321403 RepID=A0A385SME6_9BACT|nr:LD-carboxypeptidase [Chryseolinea soli]AYB30610.1 LD-carboxypeptidase [Chryseolinea soli]
MIRPTFLSAGNTVALAATGRKVSTAQMQKALEVFSSWGLNVLRAPHLFSEKHGYLAGTDDERRRDFQQMLDDKNVRAIFCARGGYGTTRILDGLDFTSFLENPKWIIGFSDVTALHLKLLQLQVESIHSTMPILFSSTGIEPSLESLKKVVFGEDFTIQAAAHRANRLGQATGPVLGGNLSLLTDALGTSSDPDTAGKILVIEEIDEYKYRFDRMLTHLKRAGKFNQLAGLIIGHMTDMKDPEPAFEEDFADMVMDKIAGTQYPVAFNFPIGHENPNLAWRHGSLMSLDVNPTGSMLQPATGLLREAYIIGPGSKK